MTGTLGLVRAALRRDRWILLWWTLGLVVLFWSTAASVPGLYTTQQAIDEAAAAIESNPAYVAMAGPAQGLDTIGGQVAWNTQVFGGVTIGLMVMFLVIRHTRSEEETGRDELLRAAPVGRLAPAASGVIVALAASLLIGVLAGLSCASTGLAFADSMAMGLGLTGCGFVFTASAWISAQLLSTARGAYGLAGGLIGLAYGMRAIGDVNAEWLSWLSPLGWYSRIQAFAGVRWWVLIIPLLATVVTLAIAAWLIGQRDYGSGLRAARPGPATGRLRGPTALAARLHRPTIIGWVLGMAVGGLAYGSIGDSADDMLGDNEQMKDMLAQSGVDLNDGFFGTALVTLALIVCGFTVASAMRPRREEEATHTETILATATDRSRWLGGHVAATVVGAVLVMFASGACLALGYWLSTGDGDYAWGLFWPAFQYVPAVLALSAFARLVYGVAPKALALGWLPLVYIAVVMFFGQLLKFPDWSRWLSPFDHLAMVPAEEFTWTPVLVITGVALALSVAGQIAFRHRDIG